MNIALPAGISGLSKQAAEEKLKIEGYNELPTEKRRKLWRVIFDIIKEPMILLLLACIGIYIAMGDIRESLVLAISIFFILFITIYQENKTEHSLEALKSLASPQAFAWRDGECIQINSRELVTSDVIFLKEGDRVPADGVIVWNKGININESLLTGESVPVSKKLGDKNVELTGPQEDSSCLVYSGTMVTAGQAIVIVKATGRQTEIGRIGKILGEIEKSKTPLQENFGQIVTWILVVAVILCISVVVLNILTAHALLPSFLSGIILAMAILPEELPVVLAIFLSLGAWRLSRHKILVRKLNVVETLGASTVLCVDKTGTLTANRMKLETIYLEQDKRLINIVRAKDMSPTLLKDEALRKIISAGSLASNRNTFDPLEKAIKDVRRAFFREDIYRELKLIHEHPLSSDFLVMANVWQSGKENKAYVKGAPEAIMSLCKLSAQEIESIETTIKKMARAGLRILGVASAKDENLSLDIKKIPFTFLGLLGFMDPVRPTALAAIKECYQAGIKVKMITGDYPETAESIAKQVGLENYDKVVNGHDFMNLSLDKLKEKIRSANVFARMMPEYKLQIISVLREDGEVVAMTGDGVNDGPALKAADIGVAMGERGTDVAREAAGMVLLDDNFSSLVSGVKEGRRIFDNLERAAVYLVAVHIPIAALSILPIIFGWPLIFFPAHIMFLELLVDPVCSIVFEAENASAGLMKRAPRNSKKSILNRKNLLYGLSQGFGVFLCAFFVYYAGMKLGWEGDKVRTAAFATLVISNIFLILVNRSWTDNIFQSLAKKNKFLWPIISIASVFLVFSIYNPFLGAVFSFMPLAPSDWIMPIILSLALVIAIEFMKIFNGSRQSKL